MLRIQEITKFQQIQRVDDWFHTVSRDDIAPIEYVETVVYNFVEACKFKGFNMSMSNSALMKILSRTTCHMYDYKDTVDHRGKLSKLPKPRFWTSEFETLWIDYITFFYFGTEFWENFWKDIPEAAWENDINKWRVELTSLLPYFVEREIDLLVDNGILFEGTDGHVVTEEDYDFPEEDYY